MFPDQISSTTLQYLTVFPAMRDSTSSKTMDSKQASAFLNLSPELRNRIYAYALLPPSATSIDARSTAGRANCTALVPADTRRSQHHVLLSDELHVL